MPDVGPEGQLLLVAAPLDRIVAALDSRPRDGGRALADLRARAWVVAAAEAAEVLRVVEGLGARPPQPEAAGSHTVYNFQECVEGLLGATEGDIRLTATGRVSEAVVGACLEIRRRVNPWAASGPATTPFLVRVPPLGAASARLS